MFWRDLGLLRAIVSSSASSPLVSLKRFDVSSSISLRFLSSSSSSTNTSDTVRFTLWDSSSKKTVELTSKHPQIFTWYSCGPTVYDSAHIGHASSYIRQDVIRRILEGMGGNVSVVQLMGVTDIDDKIINKANQLNVPWESISRKYELEFFEDLTSLNIKLPHIRSRVSEFIPQIVTFVHELVRKGLAYPTSDGSVYFDTEKYGKYGKLRKLSDEIEVEQGQGKKSMKDFAVWKGWKPNEPFWETPWGRGRPGWHIECSVMASNYFGSKVDIHTGGVDLIFPHHENEEAQCCAYFDVDKWVSHWFHTGHLNIKGDVKMSKSLGNTISIRNFLEENPPELLRMFCILSKYHNSLEFSPESLGHARSMLRKFESFLSETSAIIHKLKEVRQHDVDVWQNLVRVRNSVRMSLTNEFDTASAVHEISKYIDYFYQSFSKTPSDTGSAISRGGIDYGVVLASSAFVKDFLSLVGIGESGIDTKTTSGSREESLISELVLFRTRVRNHALAFEEVEKQVRKDKITQRKEFLEACDEVRLRLINLGIELKDHGKLTSVALSSISKKNASSS